ncbi:MAG: ABC transporter ATP-binding protein, partial [Candidatus Helarchaeota archaeon]|nr:ABC transporter ATP-binding protein [Candidatus Helarchaeota archaeon]
MYEQYLIEARGLKKTYKMGKTELNALNGVDLTVMPGEFLAIMGVSGSGKSTLLHLLGGLDRPSEGYVKIDGIDLSTLKDNQRADIRAKKVGFVFQFFNLLSRFSAVQNVRLSAEIAGASTKQAEKQALEMLKLVGLEGRANHRPTEMSGGEQQRVAIARALMNKPKIILADEPTGNLDSKTGLEILELLKKINKENGQALVIVSHDLRAGTMADRTIH